MNHYPSLSCSCLCIGRMPHKLSQQLLSEQQVVKSAGKGGMKSSIMDRIELICKKEIVLWIKLISSYELFCSWTQKFDRQSRFLSTLKTWERSLFNISTAFGRVCCVPSVSIVKWSVDRHVHCPPQCGWLSKLQCE